MTKSLHSQACVYAVALCAFLCAAPPSTVRAQSNAGSGIISGTILDPAGQAVQNAGVTVKEEATGAVHKVTSGADGRFAASALPAGVYTIEATAPGFDTARHGAVRLSATGTEDVSISLAVASQSTTVTVADEATLASRLAPVQATLDAHSAESVVTPEFIKHFTSPIGDYNDTVAMAPGTFSITPNGDGLGQSKLYFRGFPDGDYTMTFDGIPFEDTNTPTHHSWVFFPEPWVGGTVFDRSPGSASTFGPTNFGGSINLLSPETQADPNIRATVAYGNWDTSLLDLYMDSGNFGKDGKSSLTFDIQQMKSNGFETDNYQKRDAGSLKYQYRLSARTRITLWGGVVDIWNNTPNVGPTRAQIATYGYNFLNNGDPTSTSFFGYNYYHVQSDFAYIGIKTDLGSGWKFDEKAYFYRYWNKQNYANSAPVTAANGGVDKLNGYSKGGDIMTLSYESKWGIFRTGAWYEWAYTDRYQIPDNVTTGLDVATPNFHEHFITQSVQPFAEYEYKATRKLSLTAGIKSAYYNMALLQYQDNSKAVGCLGGVLKNKICTGGAAFTTHDAGYNSWLPSVAAHYMVKSNWSAYAQFGSGSIIPPSSVFDVANGAVETTPKPTIVHTYQTGSVWKNNRIMLDGDLYLSKFQNTYASYIDPVTSEPVYTLPPGGDSITKGIELEGNVVIGGGLSLYFNGTAGNAKYTASHLWVANAPKNTETIGLTWQRRAWDVGIFEKRIGQMYNDNGTNNQAVLIDPFNITNAFINYSLKDKSLFQQSTIRLSINNLFNEQNIVGVVPASTSSSLPAAGDQLTLLPGRSVILSLTVGISPKNR